MVCSAKKLIGSAGCMNAALIKFLAWSACIKTKMAILTWVSRVRFPPDEDVSVWSGLVNMVRVFSGSCALKRMR